MEKQKRIDEARRRAEETSESRAQERAAAEQQRIDRNRRFSNTKARRASSGGDKVQGDRRINCAYCGRDHPSTVEVRRCAEAHGFRALEREPAGYAITSIESIETLLGEAAPPYRNLLDAVAVARGHERWDLVERSAATALAAVTGEVPNSDTYRLVRDIAVARLKGVEYGDLVQALQTLSRQLLGNGPEFGLATRHALSDIESELGDLALLLMSDELPSLVKSASILRRDFERPDLACVTATKVVERSNDPYAALTVRSAAELDQNNPTAALRDIVEAERLQPSFYTANVRARFEVAQHKLDDAEHWAGLANSRDPRGKAGARVMMKIRALQGRFEDAEKWAKLAGHTGRSISDDWMRLQAANELIRGQNKTKGMEIIKQLSASGYRPARRRSIELEARSG